MSSLAGVLMITLDACSIVSRTEKSCIISDERIQVCRGLPAQFWEWFKLSSSFCFCSLKLIMDDKVGRGTDAQVRYPDSPMGPSPVHWETLLDDTRRMASSPHLPRACHPYHITLSFHAAINTSTSLPPISPIRPGGYVVTNPSLRHPSLDQDDQTIAISCRSSSTAPDFQSFFAVPLWQGGG